MKATGTRRRAVGIALAAMFAIGWGSSALDDAGAEEPSPALVEGGSIPLACAAVYLIVCGPWAPYCASLPSACYSRPATIGP